MLNNKSHLFFAAEFLILLCLAAYGDILTHQFMCDDRIFIKPAYIFSFYHHLGDFFNKSFDQHYTPLNFLFEVGLFQLFQKPFPLYLIDLLLFYINCVLLYSFVYLISGDFLTAILTSVLFCIHLMTGDLLQHITLNIFLVQMVFIESALIALYLYAKENKHVIYYLCSLWMVFIALFCHEMIVMFPLYAGALLFFLTDIKISRIIKIVTPFVLLSFVLIFCWVYLVNPTVHLEHVKTLSLTSFWVSSANFAHIFFWYLSNLIYPGSVAYMCTVPALNGSIWIWDLLFYGFWIGSSFLICCCLKRSLAGFAYVTFLIGFIIAFFSSQIRSGYVQAWIFEPNWVYFSSIGFYLFVVLFFLKLKKHIHKILFVALLLAVFLFYFIATLKLDLRSRTELSYVEYLHAKFPANLAAVNILASYYFNHQDIQVPSSLMPDFLNLVDYFISNDFPVVPRYIAWMSHGRISEIQRKELLYKLAAYHCQKGHQGICHELTKRIMGPHQSPDAYMQLAYIFYDLHANQPAVDILKQCMSLYPRYKKAYMLAGVILGNQGHFQESINYWKKGQAIDPTDPRFATDIAKAEVMNQQRMEGK